MFALPNYTQQPDGKITRHITSNNCSKSVFQIDDIVSFSDDEFVIGPCRSTATHDNDKKNEKRRKGPGTISISSREEDPES